MRLQCPRREVNSMTTKKYRVFGANGHRQRVSFGTSFKDDFSTTDTVRIIEVLNNDITGTNDYTIVIITRDIEQECDREMRGQLSDGIFENSRTGNIEVFDEMNQRWIAFDLY